MIRSIASGFTVQMPRECETGSHHEIVLVAVTTTEGDVSFKEVVAQGSEGEGGSTQFHAPCSVGLVFFCRGIRMGWMHDQAFHQCSDDPLSHRAIVQSRGASSACS